jgi:4-hydroxy-tetrahydrodipicolinate synthase
VDNLGLVALLMGCDGWVSGVSVAFPKENQAIWDLVRAGRIAEARAIYRWMRPLLDLDVSTFLVQQIKLAEAIAIGSTEHVRAPRLPLSGEHRARVEALVRERIASRPALPKLAA